MSANGKKKKASVSSGAIGGRKHHSKVKSKVKEMLSAQSA